MSIAGYPEDNLLGVQHNIVRHPDMPRAAFRFLWAPLKKDQEFFGYVKNLSADGSSTGSLPMSRPITMTSG